MKCANQYRDTRVTKPCGSCGKEFKGVEASKFCSKECSGRAYRGYKHSIATKKKMRDKWTVGRRTRASIPRVKRPCLVCGNEFPVKIRGKGCKTRLCSGACHREHMRTNNPMKSIENRERQASAMKDMPDVMRKRIGQSVSRAWREGKFDGAAVGRCKWYAYRHSDGTTRKVQGVWELAFCKWLDDQGLAFTAHRGWIAYETKDGRKRYWYPDFWVDEWDAYVDVKGDYFADPEKFRCVRRSNKGLRIKILKRKDLERLGVQLYVKGSCYHPDLQDLVRRSGLQPRAAE